MQSNQNQNRRLGNQDNHHNRNQTHRFYPHHLQPQPHQPHQHPQPHPGNRMLPHQQPHSLSHSQSAQSGNVPIASNRFHSLHSDYINSNVPSIHIAAQRCPLNTNAAQSPMSSAMPMPRSPNTMPNVNQLRPAPIACSEPIKDPRPSVRRIISCSEFKPHKPKQPGLRANVFVSKEATRDLAQHIVEEDWGAECGMLYKYLDYIFRCQVFAHQVKHVVYSKPYTPTSPSSAADSPCSTKSKKSIVSDEMVVFHTGLQRRKDHDFLFFVLRPNDPDKRNAEQRWRVPAGSISLSCFSAEELKDTAWLLRSDQLPQRTRFYTALHELLFDEHYTIDVNWTERLRTNKDRIYQQLKQGVAAQGFAHSVTIDKAKLVAELGEAFERAMRTAESLAKANPRLAVAQGFVETKNYKMRVELLLPLHIEYPANSGATHTFALALRKVADAQKYTGMSLLTMSMAYANARLVGYVDSSWLTNVPPQTKIRKTESKHNSETSSRLGAGGRMTFTSPAVSRQRGGYAHSQQQYVRSQGTLVGQSLPPIPSNQPSGVFPAQLLNLSGHGHNIQMANMYPTQKQKPYIIEEVDSNPPLSMSDMGTVPRANSLKFAASASAVVTAPAPPQLHNKLPEADDEDDVKNAENHHGFDLHDASEQEIEKLKFHSSAPPKMAFPTAPTTQRAPTQSADEYTRYIASHNAVVSMSTLPTQVKAYAQPATQQYGVVPYRQTALTLSLKTAENEKKIDNGTLFVLQLSRLPGDCGVNTLRQVFAASGSSMQSVHLIDEDKTALLRFADAAALSSALRFARQFEWAAQTRSSSPYLMYHDQQTVWQFAESDHWRAHHPAMGAMIEDIPAHTDLVLRHGARQYFVEKYNKCQGRQTNVRTANQRMIRSVRVHVWAPKHNPIRAAAIPKPIITRAAIPSTIDPKYDAYITGKRSPSPAKTTRIPHSEPPRGLTVALNGPLPSELQTKAGGVVMDMVQYPNWELMDEDEEVFETLVDECANGRFSGIWLAAFAHSSTSRKSLIKSRKGLSQEYGLYYLPNAADAAAIFEQGLVSSAFSGAMQLNLTVCSTVRRAFELSVGMAEGVADSDANVKVFVVDVWLGGEQQRVLGVRGNVNVTEVAHVELVACMSMNKQVLSKAMSMQ